MVIARYLNQQGSKSRQNPCQVQPTENIGNVSASRRCYELQFPLSGVLPIFQNLNYMLLQRRLSDVLPNQQSHQKWFKKFQALGALHEDKLCDILQTMAPTNVETVHQTPYSISRATSIDSDCCRLPTASVLSNKANKSRSNQF